MLLNREQVTLLHFVFVRKQESHSCIYLVVKTSKILSLMICGDSALLKMSGNISNTLNHRTKFQFQDQATQVNLITAVWLFLVESKKSLKSSTIVTSLIILQTSGLKSVLKTFRVPSRNQQLDRLITELKSMARAVTLPKLLCHLDIRRWTTPRTQLINRQPKSQKQ